MGYTVISRPEKEKHRCQLPGLFGSFRLPYGTVIECDECGKRYKKVADQDGMFSAWVLVGVRND
jgi:hypothetical protein